MNTSNKNDMQATPEMSELLARAVRVLAQLEAWLPPAPPPP